MSLLLDAIIVFSVIYIIWAAARRGFVRSVMNLLSTFASMIVAYAYTPKLAALINEKMIVSRMSDNIFTSLKEWAKDIHALQYEGEVVYNFDLLLENEVSRKGFVDILNRYRINVEEFIEKVTGLINCPEETIRAFADEIVSPTASVISLVIAFIALFLVSAIVLKLIAELLDYIFMIPALKSANTALGVVFGIAEAVVVACVLALVLTVLVDVMGAIDPGMFGADVVDKTLICKNINDIDLLSKLRDLIS